MNSEPTAGWTGLPNQFSIDTAEGISHPEQYIFCSDKRSADCHQIVVPDSPKG